MAQLLPLLLCGALLFAATPPARGHRPLLTSPVGGAAYSTWDAALPVPGVNSSWAGKRVVEASNERLPGDSRVPLLLARCQPLKTGLWRKLPGAPSTLVCVASG